jgi:hypothetical protein
MPAESGSPVRDIGLPWPRPKPLHDRLSFRCGKALKHALRRLFDMPPDETVTKCIRVAGIGLQLDLFFEMGV